MKATCIQKFRDKSNRIYSYRIAFQDRRVEDYHAKDLKHLMATKQINIDNLHLTRDNRIIDATPMYKLKPDKIEEKEGIRDINDIRAKILLEHKYMFPNGTDHCITEHSEVLGTNHKLCSSTMLLNNGLKFKVRILIAHTAVVFGLANATPNSPTLGHLIYKKTISDDLDPSSISGELNRFVGELKVNKDELFVLFGTEKAEDYKEIKRLAQEIINMVKRIQKEKIKLPSNSATVQTDIHGLDDLAESRCTIKEYDRAYEDALDDEVIANAYLMIKHMVADVSVNNILEIKYDKDAGAPYYALKFDGAEYLSGEYADYTIENFREFLNSLIKIYNYYKR